MVSDNMRKVRMLEGINAILKNAHTKVGRARYVNAMLQGVLQFMIEDDSRFMYLFFRELKINTRIIGSEAVGKFAYAVASENKKIARNVAVKLSKGGIIQKAKALVLDKRYDVLGHIERWRLWRKIVKELEELADSWDVVKLRRAGCALLYLRVAYADNKEKMEKLEEIGKKVIDKLIDIDGKGSVLYKLTGDVRFLSDVGELRKPKNWFIWR